MTAIGIELQNRCEAIKQNYTSIFDDRSNRFWVVVPLTIFAAATAQTSLVPLLFIASMFFLGLLTSGNGSGNSSYEECDYVNPRLNFLISRARKRARLFYFPNSGDQPRLQFASCKAARYFRYNASIYGANLSRSFGL